MYIIIIMIYAYMIPDSQGDKIKSRNSRYISGTIVPATTDVESLVEGYTNLWNASEKKTLRFFFSTLQSIDVIRNFKK